MTRLPVRLLLLVVCLAALGSAAYFTWSSEQRHPPRRLPRATLRRVIARAAGIAVADLRAAQQSYVAVGQGEDFWFARVLAIRKDLDDKLAELKSLATAPRSRHGAGRRGRRAAGFRADGSARARLRAQPAARAGVRHGVRRRLRPDEENRRGGRAGRAPRRSWRATPPLPARAVSRPGARRRRGDGRARTAPAAAVGTPAATPRCRREPVRWTALRGNTRRIWTTSASSPRPATPDALGRGQPGRDGVTVRRPGARHGYAGAAGAASSGPRGSSAPAASCSGSPTRTAASSRPSSSTATGRSSRRGSATLARRGERHRVGLPHRAAADDERGRDLERRRRGAARVGRPAASASWPPK